MEYRRIPHTELNVSLVGLGTMTYGEQNTEAEGHEQLDLAREHGVNLIDTAEMYPVPPKEDTAGDSERILGAWLKSRSCRDQVILATKATGPRYDFEHIRENQLSFRREDLSRAIEGSLTRLQTDRIDLYQVHWPERDTTMFGVRNYPYRDQEQLTSFQETLETLAAFQKAGKIRYVGLSNETPWGTMRYLQAAESLGLPRMVTIQNPYNLLNRTFETGLAEVAHREDIRLLAYSPLAFGKLTGKYLHGNRPAKGRLTLYSRFKRYQKPAAEQATQSYVKLATDAGLTPSQLALAFINRQPFVASNLVGATTIDQLRENISSIEIELSRDLLSKIEKTHERYPNPCP